MTKLELQTIESVLDGVKQYASPPKERTLFSIGGRGYYENPTSDLLAFFLSPTAEHGFGLGFLQAFLTCIGQDHEQLNMGWVNIQREVVTSNSNRIDIQILGPDWCLIIENKIWHEQVNPFADYESTAKSYNRAITLFSILSPAGTASPERNNKSWKGVSYLDFCRKLRARMPQVFLDESLSKWHLFAKEFIVHLETELYDPIMTPEQASFVEQHGRDLVTAHKLWTAYPEFISQQLRLALSERLGYGFSVRPNWAVLIESPNWGKGYMALRLPTEIFTDLRSRHGIFDLSIYPENNKSTKDRFTTTYQGLLEGLKPIERKGCWVTTHGFSKLDEAINFIIERSPLLNRIASP